MQSDSVLDGLNRYAYVSNNPLRYTDPTGHWKHYAEAAAAKSGYKIDYDYSGSPSGTSRAYQTNTINGGEGTNKNYLDYLTNTILAEQADGIFNLETKAILDDLGLFWNGRFLFALPVGDAEISDDFGSPRLNDRGKVYGHGGIDYSVNKGTPVKAAMKGEVIEKGSNKIYGTYIKIRHPDGSVSLYGHLSDSNQVKLRIKYLQVN